ncbi:MAG: DUF4147 domain-containing protein [Rubripirellula sp.]|nr:DUF4147 domain-containing protein [Rubripirellula sp.]
MPHPIRTDAIEMWTAGLDAVRALPLVKRWIDRTGNRLQVGESSFQASDFDRVLVVGAGKAGSAMAQGVVEQIDGWLPVVGWVNVPQGTEIACQDIVTHPARPAGVNEPTQEGVEGTRKILDLATSAGPRDLCIALISGGGSALMPAPAEGITLEDKLQVTRFLSGAGADIIQLNTVRKHLSLVKGGGLLRTFRGKQLISMILSDVLGDPLDQIASGPTVPDTTTPLDALKILDRYDANRSLPAAIRRTLESKCNPAQHNPTQHNPAQHSPPPEAIVAHENIVIGNNATAVEHSAARAKDLGYRANTVSANASEGIAEKVGSDFANEVIGHLRNTQTDARRVATIHGGEPTVILCPRERRGLGGRNQQLVLAAYKTLLEAKLSDEQWSRLCILSAGTDGEDGPTDAAGAFIDSDVHRRAVQLGINPQDHLERNDAYRFFEQTGGLLITGPTGTNVCDVRIALIDSMS